jgi:hypothetical protein
MERERENGKREGGRESSQTFVSFNHVLADLSLVVSEFAGPQVYIDRQTDRQTDRSIDRCCNDIIGDLSS